VSHDEAQISWWVVSSPEWGHALHRGAELNDNMPLIFPCCKQIKHKNNNQHAARRYASLKCCVSAPGVRGENELLMHLIRGPSESSNTYHHCCSSRRRIQSRKCSGWADYNLLRNTMHALSVQRTAHGLGNRMMVWFSIRRKKQCEQGGFIHPSLCSSNEKLPLTEPHTDRVSDRHSEDGDCGRLLLSDRAEQFT